MRTRITSGKKNSSAEPAFVCAEPRSSRPRSAHLTNLPTGRGRDRSLAWRKRILPKLRNEVAELLADIDGVPVLVLIADIPAAESDPVSRNAALHSVFSSTVQKAVDRTGGSSLRCEDHSKQALATVELISSAEHLARLPPPSNDVMLRAGPLELDLLDRTAKRGDRRMDLLPREFQLLKYMMQRNGKLLTRAALFKEVWNYRFVPETNLVDVHMGRLRRKVDGSNELPLIRNVRGAGFVLSAAPFSTCQR